MKSAPPGFYCRIAARGLLLVRWHCMLDNIEEDLCESLLTFDIRMDIVPIGTMTCVDKFAKGVDVLVYGDARFGCHLKDLGVAGVRPPAMQFRLPPML
jgi:hypothetical protein